METAYSFRATLLHKQYAFVAPIGQKQSTYPIQIEISETIDAKWIETTPTSIDFIMNAEFKDLDELVEDYSINAEFINDQNLDSKSVLDSSIVDICNGYSEGIQIADMLQLDIVESRLSIANTNDVNLLSENKIDSTISKMIYLKNLNFRVPIFHSNIVTLDKLNRTIAIIFGHVNEDETISCINQLYISNFLEQSKYELEITKLKATIVTHEKLAESALATQLINLDTAITKYLCESIEFQNDDVQSEMMRKATEFKDVMMRELVQTLNIIYLEQDVYSKRIKLINTEVYEQHRYKKIVLILNSSSFRQISYKQKPLIVLSMENQQSEIIKQDLILSTREEEQSTYSSQKNISGTLMDFIEVNKKQVTKETIEMRLDHFLSDYKINADLISENGFKQKITFDTNVIFSDSYLSMNLVNAIVKQSGHFNFSKLIEANITNLDGQYEAIVKTRMVDLDFISKFNNPYEATVYALENVHEINQIISTKEISQKKLFAIPQVVSAKELNQDNYLTRVEIVNAANRILDRCIRYLKIVEVDEKEQEISKKNEEVVFGMEVAKTNYAYLVKIIKSLTVFLEAQVKKQTIIACNEIVSSTYENKKEIFTKEIMMSNVSNDEKRLIAEWVLDLALLTNANNLNATYVNHENSVFEDTINAQIIHEQTQQDVRESMLMKLINIQNGLLKNGVIDSGFAFLDGQNEHAMETNLINLEKSKDSNIPIVTKIHDLDDIHSDDNLVTGKAKNQDAFNVDSTLISNDFKKNPFTFNLEVNTHEISQSKFNGVNILGTVELNKDQYIAISTVDSLEITNDSSTAKNALTGHIVDNTFYSSNRVIDSNGIANTANQPVNEIVTNEVINQEYTPVNNIDVLIVNNEAYIPVNILHTHEVVNQKYTPVNLIEILDIENTKIEAINDLLSILVGLDEEELKELIVDANIIELESLHLIDDKEKRKIWLIPARANWYSKWFTKKTR